jgi:hypothetical protein
VIIDVVDLVSRGLGRYEWSWIVSERRNHRLFIAVLRDAMKFDNMPMLSWHRDDEATLEGNYGVTMGSVEKGFSGVRLPASAFELQQIADLVGSMLLTPRVIDLIWLQAGLRFDCVVNSGSPYFRRLADVNVTSAHQLIEERVANKGGDKGKLVSCVGKYWCLINTLADGYTSEGPLLYRQRTACNYGWCAEIASGPGLTAGVQCWQRPGFRHDNSHFDPSQTIRVMYSQGWLLRPGEEEGEPVDLKELAANPEMAFLLTHDSKPLRYLRQLHVPQLSPTATILPPVTENVPMVLMPPTVILESRPA